MSKKGIVLAATAVALLAGCQHMGHSDGSHKYGSDAKVKCQGVNSCKGISECQTASSACKGQNSCKGHGWKMLPESECIDLGGLSGDR